MTPPSAAVLSLVLLSATTAGAGTLHSSPGTFGAYPKSGSSMAPPRPPAAPAAPGYRPPKAETGGFRPWKPSMRTDSPRGGVDAYPGAKRPKGYVSPY
jgi:hypothetical protein